MDVKARELLSPQLPALLSQLEPPLVHLRILHRPLLLDLEATELAEDEGFNVGVVGNEPWGSLLITASIDCCRSGILLGVEFRPILGSVGAATVEPDWALPELNMRFRLRGAGFNGAGLTARAGGSEFATRLAAVARKKANEE